MVGDDLVGRKCLVRDREVVDVNERRGVLEEVRERV